MLDLRFRKPSLYPAEGTDLILLTNFSERLDLPRFCSAAQASGALLLAERGKSVQATVLGTRFGAHGDRTRTKPLGTSYPAFFRPVARAGFAAFFSAPRFPSIGSNISF
jgi:hypothetical protein